MKRVQDVKGTEMKIGHSENFGGRISNITSMGRERSSYYVVPFFLKTFNIKKTDLTKLIHECIIELDNLAIQIDSKIDSKNSFFLEKADINSFDGLKSQIINCFDPLKNQVGIHSLIDETINYVEISFKFNTTERKIIYSFTEDDDLKRCTTLYLFPLVKYLCGLSTTKIDIYKIFVLLSNYIQLLDDFIDLFIDIELGLSTPVTERFHNINNDKKGNQFEVLCNDVSKKLTEYFKKIEVEISNFHGRIFSEELLYDWGYFSSELSKIPIPIDNDRKNHEAYLKQVSRVIPIRLFYGG